MRQFLSGASPTTHIYVHCFLCGHESSWMHDLGQCIVRSKHASTYLINHKSSQGATLDALSLRIFTCFDAGTNSVMLMMPSAHIHVCPSPQMCPLWGALIATRLWPSPQTLRQLELKLTSRWGNYPDRNKKPLTSCCT